MSGWKSTKSGKHFRTGTKPGISSNNNSNHSSSNSGSTQSSPMVHPERKSMVKCGKCGKLSGTTIRNPSVKLYSVVYHNCKSCNNDVAQIRSLQPHNQFS